MSMIEKVARALCVERGQDPDYSPPDCTPNWLEHVSAARAAIEAMEPTEAMLERACRAYDDATGREFADRDGMRAALQAALEGEG